jgi:hypothetical protein
MIKFSAYSTSNIISRAYTSGTIILQGGSVPVEYHATMESCSAKFHVDIPNVV